MCSVSSDVTELAFIFFIPKRKNARKFIIGFRPPIPPQTTIKHGRRDFQGLGAGSLKEKSVRSGNTTPVHSFGFAESVSSKIPLFQINLLTLA